MSTTGRRKLTFPHKDNSETYTWLSFMTRGYFFISQLLWTSLLSLRKPQLGEGASHAPQAPCVWLCFPLVLLLLLLPHFARRSMALWMCADMLMVLSHQLFGKRGVIATPASCFQGGVLCVYPQATIKTSRKSRFNHRRRSPSNRNTVLHYDKPCDSDIRNQA